MCRLVCQVSQSKEDVLSRVVFELFVVVAWLPLSIKLHTSSNHQENVVLNLRHAKGETCKATLMLMSIFLSSPQMFILSIMSMSTNVHVDVYQKYTSTNVLVHNHVAVHQSRSSVLPKRSFNDHHPVPPYLLFISPLHHLDHLYKALFIYIEYNFMFEVVSGKCILFISTLANPVLFS